MNIEEVRDYCLRLPSVTEDTPFGPDTLVFKIGGKMFMLMSLDSNPTSINLKCDPERAIFLRDLYEAVKPGYHMNKQHWNTVVLDNSVPSTEILSWINDSYKLVLASLPKKEREKITSA